MQGYLIYKKEDAQKNRRFIRMIQDAGKKYACNIQYMEYHGYQEKELPDFVLNRTREVSVSVWYERQGVPVFHQSRVVELGNDKWKLHCFLQAKKDLLHLPETYAGADKAAEILEHQSICPEDYVVKSVSGHGGEEVFLLSDFWRHGCLNQPEKWLVQERVDSDAKDVRVYILDGNIYQAVLRQGTKDFRSNYSLGGKVCPYTLSDRENRQVLTVLQWFSRHSLRLNLAGLDFIVRKDGELVFNELEETVGCRMLYAVTQKDVVSDYIKSIYMHLQKTSK